MIESTDLRTGEFLWLVNHLQSVRFHTYWSVFT